MKSPKGQAAIEYLSVFGIALVLSTPFIVKAQDSIFELRSGSDIMGMRNSMDNLRSSAETVIASGEPARRTFDMRVAESVESGRIVNDSVVYTVRTSSGTSDLIRNFDFNVTGEVPESAGRHRVTVKAKDGEAVIEVVE